MRVFQLNTFCGVKSTGRIACEIAKLVKEDGGECRIGYGVPGISQESEAFAYQIGGKWERKLHGALRKLLDAEGYGSWLATRKLIRDMKAFAPDLVHLHNVHGCYLHLPTLFRYLRKSGLPVVWTLHDCWPFTGHCAYFDYSGCEKWKTGCFDCPQQRSYPVCIGLDGSRRNYAHKKRWFAQLPHLTFVAPCEWMKQPLSESFMQRHPVRVIYNGVNPEAFRPVQSDLRSRYQLQDRRVCLSVAAEWDRRKGLPYLCEAARELGDGYRFVVIGLEKEQLTGLPDNVIGLERTADVQELAAWYTLADCFVNPTLEDNMPMVNLEALACGTPVAAFEAGGSAECLDERCGTAVPAGDVNALENAIRRICTQKPLDKEDCIRRASYYDQTISYQAYLALYRQKAGASL